MRILITGGAGFVGSALAIRFREQWPQATVVVFDNLKRRGSELNLPRFKHLNIDFVHGDIRNSQDFSELKNNRFDLFVEASAEPSVHAGTTGSPHYLLDTNLYGTVNCLEFARNHADFMAFLSTSRVYSLTPLQTINFTSGPTRFELSEKQIIPGASAKGFSEDFPVNTARSLYGTTKLASEYLIQEYIHTFKIKAVVNRCGVLVGPGQFGKVDQGVFTLWMANHYFEKALKYTGFEGSGKQVRDLLHPDDLFALLLKQLEQQSTANDQVYNVGGGLDISTSLKELTYLCQEISGKAVAVATDSKTAAVDIPIYISNHSKVSKDFAWTPRKNVKTIMQEIHDWLRKHEESLRVIFT